MKKTRIFKSSLLLLFISLFSSLSSQSLTANNTSEQSVRMYRGIINKNQELVKFIEYTFVKRGIPKHLRNLAIIESGLNHNAVSNMGAKGIWQFMTDHASEYGLTEEQRSDRNKSTKTVAMSLANLYKKYGNWITVVAAFNCGEGNIQKAMNKAGSRKYTDFANFLPAETQSHVQKYLNACYATGELDKVLNNYNNFAGNRTTVAAVQPPVSKKKGIAKTANSYLSETILNGAYNLNTIARFLQISKSDILGWNPGLEKKLKERGESIFYLPNDIMIQFEINKAKILSNSLKEEV